MSHMPRARRFALAALIAGALVASPTLSAPSWAGEHTTKSKTNESKTNESKTKAEVAAGNVTAKVDLADNAPGTRVDLRDGVEVDAGPTHVRIDGDKAKDSDKAKLAPVVVDDSSDEFKANKPKDKAKAKAEAKTTAKVEVKQVEVDCSNPLAGNGSLTHGNPATWTITVKPGCSFTGGLDSWTLPVPRFVTEQTHLDREAGTYGPGTHTLTVDRAKCWQLDGYSGTQSADSIWYQGRLIVTHIGGTEPCEEKPVPPVDEEEEPVKETPVTPIKRPVKKVERPAKRIVVKTPAPKKTVKKVAKAAPAPSQTMNALPFTGAGTTQAMMLLVGLALITAGAVGLKLVPRGVRRG